MNELWRLVAVQPLMWYIIKKDEVISYDNKVQGCKKAEGQRILQH